MAATERCVAREASAGKRRILFVFNLEDRAVTTKISRSDVPPRATDLLTGVLVDLTALQLGPKGSTVLLLE